MVSMSLDLYGLTITPPPPNGCTSSPPPPPPSTQIPNNLTSPVDTISSLTKSDQNSSVIYPWMRKSHINNTG
jgi:hypothetical protein